MNKKLIENSINRLLKMGDLPQIARVDNVEKLMQIVYADESTRKDKTLAYLNQNSEQIWILLFLDLNEIYIPFLYSKLVVFKQFTINEF